MEPHEGARLLAAWGHLCACNAMMDTLKAFGLAGFLFFLIKGLMWLVLFVLVARGVVSKEKVDRLRHRLRFRRGKRD